jgi:dTDP-4-amino-4,6-dideoxygalactose transaminase
MVKGLEKEFAAAYGMKKAVASSSGTASLHIAIGALDLEPGDEVILAPITDAGSLIGILYQNAIPIFADIDPATFNLDPADLQRKITERTRAIMAIYLFGNASGALEVAEVAKKGGIPLVEDASQAHMTKCQDRFLGTLSEIGCFSLQQSKHMTSGDGGVSITNDEKLAARMTLFRDKGWDRPARAVKPARALRTGMTTGTGPRDYLFLAPNYRMTELQGAVALAQLKKVRAVVEKRLSLGTYLSELISKVPGVRPQKVEEGSEHSYWHFAFLTEKIPSADFAQALKAEGIPAGTSYIGEPIYIRHRALREKKTYGTSGCPFTCKFTSREYEYKKGDCPNAEKVLSQMVTLGINENYTEKDIEDMAAGVKKVASALS